MNMPSGDTLIHATGTDLGPPIGDRFPITYDHRTLHSHEPAPQQRTSSLRSRRSMRSKYVPHIGAKQRARKGGVQ